MIPSLTVGVKFVFGVQGFWLSGCMDFGEGVNDFQGFGLNMFKGVFTLSRASTPPQVISPALSLQLL